MAIIARYDSDYTCSKRQHVDEWYDNYPAKAKEYVFTGVGLCVCVCVCVCLSVCNHDN